MGIAKIIGILLIAAGALGLTYGGFTYTKENVVQLSGSVATSGTAFNAKHPGRLPGPRRIDHGENSEAAAGKSAPPNRRQGTRGIAC